MGGMSLADAYRGFLLHRDHDSFEEVRIDKYLPRLDNDLTSKVNALAKATLPIFDEREEFKGNCVAIAEHLVLTIGHCIETGKEYIGSLGKGEIIFDGSDGQGIENLDFKILYLAKACLNPVALDVIPNVGTSIQIYFKEDSQVGVSQYVKPLESEDSAYATRSDRVFSTTYAGESGAPRMSMTIGAVYAIHQGESEGLKINDIYHALEYASLNRNHSRQKIAAKILKHMHVINLEMKGIYWSPLALRQGWVDEEKARVNGKITFSIKVRDKNLKKDKLIQEIFGYREIGEGRGNRMIAVHKEGIENSECIYQISPNPHENKKYNKEGQPKFYEILARSLGQYYLEEKHFPFRGNVNVFGINYLLNMIQK